MADLIIASDADWLRADVRSVLSAREHTVREVTSGIAVVQEVRERTPDLVVLEQSMGNMGGFATAMELHLRESAGELDHVPCLLLLDRRADVFLARRAEVEGYLVKPLDPIRIRKAVRALLDGGTYHDDAWAPHDAVAGPDVQSLLSRPAHASD